MVCSNCGKDQPEDARFCSACGAAMVATVDDPGLQPGQPRKKRSGCVVALIVVGVLGILSIPPLGIIAAIAIPNLLNAIDRGKQKRTMADMRSIGTAIESYSIDHEHYPTADDVESLQALVAPLYIRVVPPVDGWEQPWHIDSRPQGYRIRSPGKGGEPDSCQAGETSLFTSDICFENGSFTQWPEGIQQ